MVNASQIKDEPYAIVVVVVSTSQLVRQLPCHAIHLNDTTITTVEQVYCLTSSL